MVVYGEKKMYMSVYDLLPSRKYNFMILLYCCCCSDASSFVGKFNFFSFCVRKKVSVVRLTQIYFFVHGIQYSLCVLLEIQKMLFTFTIFLLFYCLAR